MCFKNDSKLRKGGHKCFQAWDMEVGFFDLFVGSNVAQIAKTWV